jgi:molybdopterin molybdotransferase
MSEPAAGVLDFDEALRVVMAQAAGVGRPGMLERELAAAGGWVLAEAVKADRDQPPFDRSTRDGYAVRARDLASGGELQVVGQVRAGELWRGAAVASGSAVEIMTGAPVPDGADAVVMMEHVLRDDGAVHLGEGRRVERGENIVLRGSEARAGETVVGVGTVMDAAEIALAAACGRATLRVFARPTVAIVATGDELVEVDVVPKGQQIRNSNSYGLAALVAKAGGDAVRMPIAPDRRGELETIIRAARVFDLMILSGGVSMGEYDLVEEVLVEMGAEFFFTGVRMQPGKPVVFGRLPAAGELGERYFFGLPGNPVSTQVTFHCFAEPLLRAMCGAGVQGPRFVQATLAEDVAGKAGLMRMLPARVSMDRVRPEVRLVGWRGSGDLAANARANCYAVLPPEREGFVAGDVITILLR